MAGERSYQEAKTRDQEGREGRQGVEDNQQGSLCCGHSCLTLCDLMDCSPPGSSVHGILQARILEWVAMPSCSVSSWPRDRTQFSRIAGGFFTSWVTREALDPGVGSLSLLQGIFPTWESNWGLLHCRQIFLPAKLPGTAAAAAAKSLQSCPTLCNPIDGSPPGSPIPGILQARTLEWAAISFSTRDH